MEFLETTPPPRISETTDILERGWGMLIFALALFSPEQGGRQRLKMCSADRNENARDKHVFQGSQETPWGSSWDLRLLGGWWERTVERPLPISSWTASVTEAPGAQM